MPADKRSPSSSSDSSDDERARRQACQSVCLPTPAPNPSKHKTKRLRKLSKGVEPATLSAQKTLADKEAIGENGEKEKFKRRAAVLLDQHLQLTWDFDAVPTPAGPLSSNNANNATNEPDNDKSTNSTPGNDALPHASLHARSATANFRLFADSPRGLIFTHDGRHPPINTKQPSRKKRRRKGDVGDSSNGAGVISSSSDDDSSQEEQERIERARSVAVDAPLPPLRARTPAATP